MEDERRDISLHVGSLRRSYCLSVIPIDLIKMLFLLVSASEETRVDSENISTNVRAYRSQVAMASLVYLKHHP